MSKLGALIYNKNANVAVITALCALPLVGTMGLAVDFGVAMNTKSRLDAASDAAALVGIKTMAQSIQGGSTTANAISAGKQSALKAFAANAAGLSPDLNVDLQLNGNVISSSARYSSSINLAFGKLFGVLTGSLSGVASASMSLPSYINFYLMVDLSGSMAIGSSSTDQQNLINQTGCAFACHDGNPVNGYADAYAYAEGRGISLRYDVLNKGIQQFLDSIDATDPSHQFMKVAVYSFDSTLNNAVPLTSNTSTVRQNLPNAPSTSGDYEGATHFNESIPTVISAIGSGGDGTSSVSPKKIIIIATDGVQDPSRTWTWNLPLRPQVQVIDTSFCSTLSGRNVAVSFIHTPYLPMPWDWGYVATLGQSASSDPSKARADLVQPALQSCAGNLYSLANDTTSLTNAFTKIFQAYVGSRLTK